MIGTQITIKNHDTGAEVVLNDHTTDPENVIALQAFPTFEKDVRNQNQPRSGAHGEFRLPTYYGGMSIVLQGVIAADDEATAWGLKNALDGVMSLSRSGYAKEYEGDDAFPPMFGHTVRLSFTTPDGKSVFVDATPIKPVSYDRPLMQGFLLNFQVILRATSPYLYVVDDDPNVETGSLGSILTGFVLPMQLPLNIGEQQVEGEMTITMQTAGYAVVTLNGSDDGVVVNPTITNLTNGTRVKIRKALASASEYFVIDGIYQTMKDEDGASVLPFADGEFIYLDAGVNTLVYTADAVIPN